MVAPALQVFTDSLSSGTSTGIATIQVSAMLRASLYGLLSQGLLSVLSSSSATTVQELVHHLRSLTISYSTSDRMEN